MFRTLEDSPDKGETVCQFIIESTRLVEKQTGIETEISFFDVEAWGSLAELCRQQGRKNMEVRIVGKLKQVRWLGESEETLSKVIIVAEHIEFRPEKKGE